MLNPNLLRLLHNSSNSNNTRSSNNDSMLQCMPLSSISDNSIKVLRKVIDGRLSDKFIRAIESCSRGCLACLGDGEMRGEFA